MADAPKKRSKEEEEEYNKASELEKAEYRVKMLLRTLAQRDEALAKAEEELAKRDYQIMHLKKALETSSKTN